MNICINVSQLLLASQFYTFFGELLASLPASFPVPSLIASLIPGPLSHCQPHSQSPVSLSASFPVPNIIASLIPSPQSHRQPHSQFPVSLPVSFPVPSLIPSLIPSHPVLFPCLDTAVYSTNGSRVTGSYFLYYQHHVIIM